MSRWVVRNAERCPINIPVTIKTKDSVNISGLYNTAEGLPGMLIDLSEKGCGIKSRFSISVLKEVEIVVDLNLINGLESNGCLSLKAIAKNNQTMSITMTRIGFEFLELEVNHIEMINRIIQFTSM